MTIVSGALFAMHSWQLSRTATTLLSHADSLQKTHPEKAAEYIGRYLRIDPTDNDACVKRADIYGEYASASKLNSAENFLRYHKAIDFYNRALIDGLEPSVEFALRQKLGDLLLKVGRFSDAESVAEKIIQKSPEHAAGNRIRALATYRQFEAGAYVSRPLKDREGNRNLLKELDTARRLNLKDETLAAALATYYRQYGNVVADEAPEISESERLALADQCFEVLISTSPKNAKAFLARSAYRTQFQLPGAKDDLKRAQELAPGDVDVLHASAFAALEEARTFARTPDKSAARKAFQVACDAFELLLAAQQVDGEKPTDETYLGLGDARLGLGNADAAIQIWQDGIAHFSGMEEKDLRESKRLSIQISLQSRIADARLQLNQLDESSRVLNEIDQLSTSLGPAISREDRHALSRFQKLRRGILNLQEGKPEQAIPHFKEILATQRQAAADIDDGIRACMLLADAYARLGAWQDSALAYDQATEIQRNLPRVYLASGNAWLMAGRPNRASERAEQSLALEKSAGGWYLLALAQFRQQTLLPAQNQNWKRLEQALNELRTGPSDSTLTDPWRASFLAADYSLIKAKASNDSIRGIPEAVKELREAETRFATSLGFLNQLYSAYQQFALPQDADRVVEQIRKVSPDSIDADLATAQLAISRKEFDRAAQLLDSLSNRMGPSDEARIRSARLRLALSKRDLKSAIVLLGEEAARNPSDVNTLKRLTELYLEQGDYESVKKQEDLLSKLGTPGQSLVHYFRANRLLAANNVSDASNEQKELARLRPQWAETYTLLGQIEEQLHHTDQAIAAYEQAIQLGETRTSIYAQLIILLERQQRFTDAASYLSKIESQIPLSQRLTEIETVQQLRNDRPEEALRVARDGVASRPDDPDAHISLGRMLLVSNQSTDAEREFLRAVELDPTGERGWNSLFTHYVRTGDKAKARETLGQMTTQMKLADKDRNFVLAQAYEYLGDIEEAAKFYEKAVTELPDNVAAQLRFAAFYLHRDPPRTEGFLRRARELDPANVPARQMLATFLGSRGTPEGLAEAEKLLNEAGSVTSENRRLNALLLARHGGAKKTDDAVKIMEDVTKNGGGETVDQLALAQLYEMQATWMADESASAAKLDAVQRMLKSIADKVNPDIGYPPLVDFLIRHKKSDEAGVRLDSYEQALAKRKPFSVDAVSQLIQLRMRHGSIDKCTNLLDELDKHEPNSVRFLSMRAQVLSAAGKIDQIKPLVEARATQILAATAENADKVRVQGAIGDLYAALKDFASAEAWYRQFVASQPERFDLIATNVARQGRVGEAIEICAAAAKTDDTAKPANVLATILIENPAKPEEFAAGETMVAAAVQRFPTHVGLQYTAALVHVLRNRNDQAIQGFRQVIKLNPQHAQALNNLAFLLGEQSSGHDEALELIDRALQISPSDPGFLDTKGTILMNHGKYEEATKWLVLAVKGSPPDPRYNFHLALAYSHIGDLIKARQELQKALDQKLDSQVLTPKDKSDLEGLRKTLQQSSK